MDLNRAERALELLEIETQKVKGLAETRRDLAAATNDILAATESFSATATAISEKLSLVSELKATVEQQMNDLYRQQSSFVREVDGVVTERVSRASTQLRSDLRDDLGIEIRRIVESVEAAGDAQLERVESIGESIASQARRPTATVWVTLVLLLTLLGLDAWEWIEPLIQASAANN